MSDNTATPKNVEEPKPKAKAKVESVEKVRVPERKLVVTNRMMQKVAFNVLLPDGTQAGYELGARGSRAFPYSPNGLGPDVDSKKRKGYLSVFEKS